MNELTQEVGFVVSSQDYLLFLEGFPGGHINDIIIHENGAKAIISTLDGDRVKALMIDPYRPKPGEIFKLSSDGIRLPLGNYLFGRTVNPLGIPIDGKSALPLDGPLLNLDTIAVGIKDREPIDSPLATGFAINDILLPVGLGQRELIIGDPRSHKSGYLLDIIINQKGRNMVCIYTAIGKPEIDTRRFASALTTSGAFEYTIMIAANSSIPAPLIGLAPAVAFSVAEHFSSQGRDVLLILDDLGVHAKYLREIALLSMQSPGRESYPGNIFYEHSHLMERAGRFKKELGGGSITLFPILETDLDSLTNLIPTNLMSQTDGHLLFSASLASQGQYPALEWNRSVTRVGRQTQPLLAKLLGTKIRTLLAEFRELEKYSQFDAELSENTQMIIRQARMVVEMFNQEGQAMPDIKTQTIFLSLVFTSILKDKNVEYLRARKAKFIEIINRENEFKNLAQSFTSFTDLESFLEALELKSETLEKLVG